MRDILLITNYWHFEEEKASSRYFTLADMIVEAGMKLELVTSSFYHASKCQRSYKRKYLNSFPYKITLVKEGGYPSNTSLNRLYSQWVFGRNVLKYIKKRKKPDLIYCVVPSLEVADLMTRYANKHNIKIIIDIQDLWPEAFQMILSLPLISRILFDPLRLKSERIYSRADQIIAVSQTYAKHALSFNHHCKEAHCVYLGLDLNRFDIYASEACHIEKEENEIWIVYVGTLGYSYDLISVMDAISLIKSKGYDNIKLHIIGEGPRRKEFEEAAKQKYINAIFTGKLEYSLMVKKLCKCDIAVNPIVKNSAASIINKHADYAAASLPVINTQESREYKKLLDRYNAGLNCINGNIEDLAEKLLRLIVDKETRITMGKNNRRLAEERFDREKTYKKIVDILMDEKNEKKVHKEMIVDEEIKEYREMKADENYKEHIDIIVDEERKEYKEINEHNEYKGKNEIIDKQESLQLLLSTMNQKDYSLIEKMNISSDTIVINQWDRYQWEKFCYKGKSIIWVSNKERGVGLSRNTALMKSTADICLFSDEDMIYIDAYEEKMIKAFQSLPKADVIIFDIKIIGNTKDISNYRSIKKIKKLNIFNSMRYGACRIAVRRESIFRENIYFSLLFGGGARYSAGEDSIFIRECLRKKLKLYAYPLIIGYVDDSTSSWYEGITDKLLMDKGALLAAAFPKLYPILFIYYAIILKKKCPKNMTIIDLIKKFIHGRKQYKKTI